MSSRSDKLALLMRLVNDGLPVRPTPEIVAGTLGVEWHGLPLEIHCPNVSTLEALRKMIPAQWLNRPAHPNPLPVHWLTPEQDDWDEDILPFCDLHKFKDAELAVQRDFAGIDFNRRVVIICKPEVSDGFFNALRWFLPRRLLTAKRALLHSSVVVGTDGFARFFLGPSGAGKSTITTLANLDSTASKRLVLGDDMNIVTVGDDGQLYAEVAFVGQGRPADLPLGEQVPVEGFYFLKQDPANGLRKLNSAEAVRRLFGSFANLFWSQRADSVSSQAFTLASEIATKSNLFELSFNLTGEFWNYVERKDQTIRASSVANHRGPSPHPGPAPEHRS